VWKAHKINKLDPETETETSKTCEEGIALLKDLHCSMGRMIAKQELRLLQLQKEEEEEAKEAEDA
jgi:hypothetical protein